MKISSIIVGFITVLVISISSSAALKMKVLVVPRLLAPSDAYTDPVIPEEIYISRKYVHFSEDYGSDKGMRNYVDRYSFMSFNFRNGKLVRDLFFILNPEGIDSDGFYRVECDVVKKEVRPTIRVYDVRVVRIQKSATSIDAIKKSVHKKISDNVNSALAADFSPLYKNRSQVVKVNLNRDLIFSKSGTRGINSLEYLGGGGGRHTFRFLLGNADTEKQKKERNTARGYFCYIDLNTVNDKVDIYYTIVDFSIYIK